MDGRLYTASSDFISSDEYKFGLFDEDNYIKSSTVGKDIQDIYENKEAYIDIKNSFLNTKLYIDGEYFNDVASSALFDKNGNIYYFKQNKDKRELYKNKTKLFELSGYYGRVVDIVDGVVYFIANSDNGSTLYKYDDTKLYRLKRVDNITDAKLVDKNTAVVVTTTANGYEVSDIKLDEYEIKDIPTSQVFTLEEKFLFDRDIASEVLKPSKYNELKELQYSMLYPYYAYDSVKGSSYNLSATFLDPVMFNMLNLFHYKDNELNYTGVSYTNERYIPFKITLYDVDRKDKKVKERGDGGSFEFYGPLIKKGRHQLDANIKYYLDDENKDKNPTVLSLGHTYQRSFANENSPYLKLQGDIVGKKDREDTIYGFEYEIDKHLFDEFYINAKFVQLDSDIKKLGDDRGIKVVTKNSSLLEDRTNQLMEGSDFAFYAKEFQKSSLGVSKTFFYSVYFESFPLSLRKESLFYQYNQFDITSLNSLDIKEHIVGIELDLLVAHKLPLPINIKYIENDLSKDDYKVKVTLGVQF
jgi:hypothetical protein